jgi:hypothetical protein
VKAATVTAALVAASSLASPAAARAAPSAGFTIELSGRADLHEAEAATISLSITPAPGRTLSADGPLLVRLAAQPEAAIELSRRRYRRTHAADPRARALRFDLALRPRRPGRHQLTVELRFWLCGRHTCWPVRAQRTVSLDVGAGDQR